MCRHQKIENVLQKRGNRKKAVQVGEQIREPRKPQKPKKMSSVSAEKV
jgi:hypothetical protein